MHANDKSVRYEDGIAKLRIVNVTFADKVAFQDGGGGGLGPDFTQLGGSDKPVPSQGRPGLLGILRGPGAVVDDGRAATGDRRAGRARARGWRTEGHSSLTVTARDTQDTLSSTGMRDVAYYFAMALLLTHALDAVPNREWRGLPLLRALPDALARIGDRSAATELERALERQTLPWMRDAASTAIAKLRASK